MSAELSELLPAGRLAHANPDPRAAYLRFDAAAHQYYVNGQPATAVSSVYKRFFPEFDAAYWAPRKAAERGCAPEVILQEWAANAAAAAAAGSALHQRIESFYNDAPDDGDATAPDYRHFRDFQRAYADLQPYRTEWQVYDEDLLLAGTIDLVTRNADGSVSMYDWKRSTKIVDRRGQLIGSGQPPLHGPLGDLPNCSFSSYSLQLNLYKWLLETRYGLHVRDMQLVVLCPSYDRFHVVPVPHYPRHVAQMLAIVREHQQLDAAGRQ